MGNGISSDKPTRRENFAPSVNDQQAAYLERNSMRYNTTEPNIYIIPVENQSNISDPANTHDMFGVFNMYNNSNNEGRQISVSPLSRIFDFMVSPSVSADLIASNDFCKSFNTLTRNVTYYFDNYYDPFAETRCGWTYNPNFNGRVRFEGHLGNNNNPITSLDTTYITHSNTRWYWNLADAIIAFKRYKCQVTVSNCSNINPECAWSQGLGYAIPRLANNVYTPQENNVITATTYCPATSNTSNIPITGTGFISSNCSNDYQISRNCLYDMLTYTKCDTGALHHALETGSLVADHGISAIPSFMRYNQVYPANINLFNGNSNLSNGGSNNTITNALQYFNQLSNVARSSSNDSIKFAARDLCISRATYENFDFCTEYVDETTKPASGWLINCVQDSFRRKGGQITGKHYPTASNMASIWNNYTTWGNLKLYINQLSIDTSSTNIDVQADAYSKFYGIPTQQYTRQYVSRIPGIEVFWFSIMNSSTNSPGIIDTFLGRRIQNDLTLRTPNRTTNIQFISFFNVRSAVNNKKIKFSYTVQNGIKVLKNTWIDTFLTLAPLSGSNVLSAWYPVTTPTSYSNASNIPTDCWTLSSNNPNYFTVAWYSGTTAGSFSNNYFETCDTTPVAISPDDFTMSQEPDAPMISYEVFPEPTQNQLDYYSADQTLSYFFGDTRLWKVFPIVNIGSTSPDGFINNNEHFGFSTRFSRTDNTYTSRSYLYGALHTSSSGIVQTGRIMPSSWRTITMLFKTGSLTDIAAVNTTHYIFQYGKLSIGIKNIGTSTSPSYKCVVDKGSSDNTLGTILSNTYYYLIVIVDPYATDGAIYGPTLKVCCAPLAEVQANMAIPFGTGSTVITFNTDIESIWAQERYQASIGGKNSTGLTQTVVMDVGWLRFFDYVFTTDDVGNDVNNRWQKHWFNVI